MQIRDVSMNDIQLWEALSLEYDTYVLALVGDLTQWYEGDGDTLPFTKYMEDKIFKQEAFIAVDSENVCLGIGSFSKRNNRITFFGISHHANFFEVGNALLLNIFRYLDLSREIRINEIASPAQWIENHRNLYTSFGFVHIGDDMEVCTPVNVFSRPPDFM